MTNRPMLASALHWGQPCRAFRQRLVFAACAGLLAPITVACGSGGSSADYSSPPIRNLPPALPQAAEVSPNQLPEKPPSASSGGGSWSGNHYRGTYDASGGCEGGSCVIIGDR